MHFQILLRVRYANIRFSKCYGWVALISHLLLVHSHQLHVVVTSDSSEVWFLLCKMLVRMRRNRDFVSFMGFYVVCRFSQILVSAPHWPIRSGQVLLLLELLLQAHQLQLSKNSTAATWLLQAGCAALSLRLAADAEGRLAGWQLGASGMLWGKQWQMWMGSARRGRLRDVSRQVGRLPRDHWEERVGT